MVLPVTRNFGAIAFVDSFKAFTETRLIEQNATLETCSLCSLALGFKLKILWRVNSTIRNGCGFVRC